MHEMPVRALEPAMAMRSARSRLNAGSVAGGALAGELGSATVPDRPGPADPRRNSAPALPGPCGVTYLIPRMGDVPIVAVEREIDPMAVIAFQRRISVALAAGHRSIVVDLSAATVVGGRALNMFCGALRRVNRRGARLMIAGARPAVRRVLERCAIDGVELYSSLRAARLAAGEDGRAAGDSRSGSA